ncbi:MAG: hypothetical protein IJH79_05575 [Lentisphaeria bacterium]|nr:hypothetical protein [Lentisphaeria bacterium]
MEHIVASKRDFFNAEEEKTELFRNWRLTAAESGNADAVDGLDGPD